MTSPEIKAFRVSAKKIAALYKALQDPAIMEALTLIRLANQPVDSPTLPVVAGLHHDCVVSREYHKMFGVNDAISTLYEMSTAAVEPEPDEPERQDFEHSIDSDLLPAA